jgi:N-acetylglucosamine kinase-like BadF-type ATPase
MPASVFTFTDANITDLTYELNDGELFNDVMAIVGEPDAENLVRWIDAGSITKYGRRSFKIDQPLNVDDAGADTLIDAMLDRTIEPYPNLSITVQSTTDALIKGILDIEISDKVTVTETTMGLSAVDFIVENIDMALDTNNLITATYGMVQARAGE